MTIETITLGGGCFWCLDSAFRMIKGVRAVASGYSGGDTDLPSYREVCTGETGHAEVVHIDFDTREVDVETLLRAFFSLHDPTTLNKQGADVGTQYRSVIFYHNDVQKQVAQQLIDEINSAAIWPDPVVTELSPFDVFYEAEPYHQDYYAQNPHERYCQWVIEPKLKKFREHHQNLIHS